MPQMSPLNWLVLFILFSMMMMLLNIINYYNFSKTSNWKFLKKSSTINWKW